MDTVLTLYIKFLHTNVKHVIADNRNNGIEYTFSDW